VRRRVWCETLPFDDVGSPATTQLLARHKLDLLLAVRPWQLDQVGELVKRVQGAGVFVGLWPMLADEDGRWASVASSTKFVALVDEMLVRAPSADELVIDLEPPLYLLERWKDGDPTWRQTPSPRDYRDGRDRMVDATTRWTAERRVTTAVMPLLAVELAGRWIQRALGTPATDLPVARHSVMAYTSLFEGWSRGLVSRRRAELLLSACARLSRLRFGDRAGLSLGTVGTGAFGDEPCYRDPSELARDVQLARKAGIEELSLFDLGGVIRRSPASAWLDAFCAESAESR
jgi:hypothetical protein